MPDRRQFLAASAALTLPAAARAAGANDRLVVAVMGLGGQGTMLAKTFAQQPNTEVAFVCDPDPARAGKAADEVGKVGKTPQAVADFRKALDDKSVGAVVCATPNHWHAPATILACAAGKHVYVEKPCSHNPREGELMVQAARKADRRVQMGNMRRSWPAVIEAIEALHKGEIGRVYLAQSWYQNNRAATGVGHPAQPPEGLDYDMWQGPAPRKPFRSNYLHYTWHWFWHWGNGELGNNGIHFIDVCRWGLGVELPTRVTSAGGRYRYRDDQETPDTHLVAFDFDGGRTITWQGTSCNRLPDGSTPDILFTGETGGLAIKGSNYVVYDAKGKEVRKQTGPGGYVTHVANFVAAVRDGKPLTAEIEGGHKSTLLCHLGNIAHRVGRSLTCDPKTGRAVNDADADKLWGREYEKGWEPRV